MLCASARQSEQGTKKWQKHAQITHTTTKYVTLAQKKAKTRDRDRNLQGSQREQAAVTHQVHSSWK